MIDYTILFSWLGWLLIFMPVCLSQNTDKQCFSQSLKPSYPCCKGDKVVYIDMDGNWGVEHGKWCGIGNGHAKDDICFSLALGYKCCEKCKVVYTDKDGEWGVENKKWCGIKDSCTKPVELKDPKPVQDYSEFDFAFLKMENGKNNMLYSPLSIEYALKMLQEGAANNTLAEINKVLGNIELPKYTSIEKVLSLANGLFIRDTYFETVKEEYINTLKEKYDAEIKKDEFKDAKNINQWIEDKTLGIIKDMLKDELLKFSDIKMLIINTLAIDMEWVTYFEGGDTCGQIFYLDDGEEMIAATMTKKREATNEIAYYMNDDITVLTMNLRGYYGIQFEFMAIMPNENLSDYVEKVTKAQINEIDKNLKFASSEEGGLNIRIPKFQFDYDLKLKEDLINLGVKDTFDPNNADFSNIAKRNLYVSDALQKANIEFNEYGVKAAAVTEFVVAESLRMLPRGQPLNIIIDKPFMFIIRDKNTKNIWFTGTVYEPSTSEDDKNYCDPDFGLDDEVFTTFFGFEYFEDEVTFTDYGIEDFEDDTFFTDYVNEDFEDDVMEVEI